MEELRLKLLGGKSPVFTCIWPLAPDQNPIQIPSLQDCSCQSCEPQHTWTCFTENPCVYISKCHKPQHFLYSYCRTWKRPPALQVWICHYKASNNNGLEYTSPMIVTIGDWLLMSISDCLEGAKGRFFYTLNHRLQLLPPLGLVPYSPRLWSTSPCPLIIATTFISLCFYTIKSFTDSADIDKRREIHKRTFLWVPSDLSKPKHLPNWHHTESKNTFLKNYLIKLTYIVTPRAVQTPA